MPVIMNWPKRAGKARFQNAFNEAARLIIEERISQVAKKGYEPRHDDSHTDDELAFAAICYATPPRSRQNLLGWNIFFKSRLTPGPWPWSEGSWHPSNNRKRELAKAGALILAELERLIRAEADAARRAEAHARDTP